MVFSNFENQYDAVKMILYANLPTDICSPNQSWFAALGCLSLMSLMSLMALHCQPMATLPTFS